MKHLRLKAQAHDATLLQLYNRVLLLGHCAQQIASYDPHTKRRENGFYVKDRVLVITESFSLWFLQQISLQCAQPSISNMNR